MGTRRSSLDVVNDGMEFINGGFDGTTGLLLAKDAANKFLGHLLEYDCENRPLETIKQAIADRLSDRLTHFAAERVYELIQPLGCLSDERITAVGLALGGDGLDLEDHQRACSIEASASR